MNPETTRDDLLGLLAALRSLCRAALTAPPRARRARAAGAALRARRRVRPRTPGWRSPRSTSTARRPLAIAPSMSSARLSPTMTASSGAAPPSASAAAKIVAHGLRRPCALEASAKSTRDAQLRGERRELAIGVGDETDPAAARAQDVEQRDDVGVELEIARIAPLLLRGDADLLGHGARRAHAPHDLDREAPVLRAAVIERLALPDVERILARLLVPSRGRAGRRSARRARHSRSRRRRGAGGST